MSAPEERKRSMLLTDLTGTKPRTRWFLRVVSLLLSLALWFYSSWNEVFSPVTATLEEPLIALDVPPGCEVSVSPELITVYVSGGLDMLSFFWRDPFSATVSLSGLEPGVHMLPITVASSTKKEMTGYTPREAEVEIYRVVTRRLEPEVEIIGSPPRGVRLSEPFCTPSEIEITGREELVDRVASVTARATLSSLMDDGSEVLSVVLLDASGNVVDGLTPVPGRVTASVTVTEEPIELRVPVRVSVTGEPARGQEVGEVTAAPAAVTLRGTRQALANITELALRPVDVTGAASSFRAELPIDPPEEGISITDAGSVVITVELHSAMDTVTLADLPIYVRGEGAYGKWIVEPGEANVTIERPAAASGDAPPLPKAELYVDVTDVVADKLMLPVRCAPLDGGAKMLRIDPVRVRVTAVKE